MALCPAHKVNAGPTRLLDKSFIYVFGGDVANIANNRGFLRLLSKKALACVRPVSAPGISLIGKTY